MRALDVRASLAAVSGGGTAALGVAAHSPHKAGTRVVSLPAGGGRLGVHAPRWNVAVCVP
jgi:hypothetical protein